MLQILWHIICMASMNMCLSSIWGLLGKTNNKHQYNIICNFCYMYSTDRAKVHTKFANSKYANLTYGPNTHHQYSFAVITQHKIISAFYQTRIDTWLIMRYIAQHCHGYAYAFCPQDVHICIRVLQYTKLSIENNHNFVHNRVLITQWQIRVRRMNFSAICTVY